MLYVKWHQYAVPRAAEGLAETPYVRDLSAKLTEMHGLAAIPSQRVR